MNKLLLTLFCFLFIASSTGAQPLWKQLNGPSDARVMALAVDSEGTLYLAARCVYRSLDSGHSWANVSGNAINSPSSNYSGGAHALAIRHGGGVVVAADSTILYSTDHGGTWATLGSFSSSSCPAIGNDDRVLVADGNRFLSWKSDTLWRSIGYTTIPVLPIQLLATRSGVLLIAAASTDWSSNNMLFRSTDSGKTWGKIVNGLDHATISAIAEGPDGKLYMPSNDSIMVSTDRGRTWSTYMRKLRYGILCVGSQGAILKDGDGINLLGSTIPITVPPSVIGGEAVTAAPSGRLYASNGGILVSINPPVDRAWTYLTPPTGSPSALAILRNGRLMASSLSMYVSPSPTEDISFSNDGGTTWAYATQSISEIYKIALDSAGIALALMDVRYGTGPYYHPILSSDNGDSWTVGPALSNNLSDICVAPNGSIFISSDIEGVFRSTDHGGTWDQLTNGLANQAVSAVTVNMLGEVFAGTDAGLFKSSDNGDSWHYLACPVCGDTAMHHIYSILVVNMAGAILDAIRDKGVYISTDDGLTWDSIGTGLPTTYVNALLSTPSGHVFAGTTSGVYYLPSKGGAWISANIGLTAPNVLSMTRNSAGTVYLGVENGGVFRSTMLYNLAYSDGVQAARRSTEPMLAVFPNPANTDVSIYVPSLRDPEIEKLQLINVLGEAVQVSCTGSSDTDGARLTFNVANVPVGVYHIRVWDRANIAHSAALFVSH